jgi:hypothetical protein
MKSLPKSLRIGPFDYEVKLQSGLFDGGQRLSGHCKYSTSEIVIDADEGPQAQHATLWHEIVHAIINNADGSKHDEALVNTLGHGIMQVLRDNPELKEL